MPFPPPKTRRRGFTLLEVILAGALTAVVMLAVAACVNVQLRAFVAGRESVEKTQLARAILHKIADDLRGLVSLHADKGAAGGTTESSAPEDEEFDELFNDPLGAEFDLDAAASEPPAAPAAGEGDSQSVPPVVGLCGELDWIRIDALLPVRSAQTAESAWPTDVAASQSQVAGELRSVAYYVVAADVVSSLAAFTSRDDPRGGLVRREIARAEAVRAAEAGQLDNHDPDVASLAPEIASVEFRYFDGTDWLESWNSAETGKLPKAVDIRLFFSATPNNTEMQTTPERAVSAGTDAAPKLQFRLIVPIPGASQ